MSEYSRYELGAGPAVVSVFRGQKMLIRFFTTFGPQVEGGDVQVARGSDGRWEAKPTANSMLGWRGYWVRLE